MLSIMQNLLPIQYEPKTIIFEEVDEASIIFFVATGLVDYGYEINRQKKFVLRRQREPVGLFEIFQNIRFQYVVRTFNHCTGYFIRRHQWLKLKEIFPQAYNQISDRLCRDYVILLKDGIMKKKNADIETLKRRNGFKEIITMHSIKASDLRLMRRKTLHRMMENFMAQTVIEQH